MVNYLVHPGLKASIKVLGYSLLEFDDEVEANDPTIVMRYVEAQTGFEFEVVVRFTEQCIVCVVLLQLNLLQLRE